ncbi:MAG: polysulfide reductase NrfD [Candidatus Dormibacteraeota bacterium]|uniref:Polysulfide reductase NrfD n=1 Tax=Candidatus Dormiibacter inghamiae TaxID=3127013 RepID=A0A934NDR3_9BACT|nr:polysulfide reductase NrfD [Candidatus Dormibacteraeota bacterium]MBJ7606744.1 polysulfide reductase NrfD [Candidatus Dormibacteraeota bacterium]
MTAQTTAEPGYYGRPVLKEPVWKPEVAVYFWLGGLAGISAVLGFTARLSGNDRLARRAWFIAFGALLPCPPLLIADLGRPERFYNMLRVLKPTSPMSMGTWVLTGFGGVTAVAAAGELLGGVFATLGRVAEGAAALLGLPLATYTAVLLADTSVPVWHHARHHLPFVFAGSATASAGAAAAILTPSQHSRPARLAATFGALLELGASFAMERRLGPDARHYHEGAAAGPAQAARALTGAGAALMTLGGRRPLAIAAGVLLLAGSLAERFAVLRAGPSSARATADGGTVRG